MKARGFSPIFVYVPTSSEARMKTIAEHARGFIYCVGRKGVPGQQPEFSDTLPRCRKATSLPLALGFGVKDRADIDYLSGKVEIAVIGTQTIRVVEERGVAAVGDFIRELR